MEQKGTEEDAEPESPWPREPGARNREGQEPKAARVWEWTRKILERLGLVPHRHRGFAPGTDLLTALAQDRTDLAMVRNFMAAERTLMAWIRTSLSMISFGFGIAKIIQTLEEPEFGLPWLRNYLIGAGSIGYTLVLLGTGALIIAILQHQTTMRELCAMGMERRYSLTRIIAILLSFLGIFAFSSLVLKM